MRKVIAATAVLVLMAGCATPARKISAAYVSPMSFNSYDCNQLAAESQRIGARVNQLGASVDKQARQDKWATGIGLFLFWPALFMIDGDEGMQADYARLKGEYDAVEEAAIARGCLSPRQVAVDGSIAPQPQAVLPPPPVPGSTRYEPDPSKRCDACQHLLGNH
jgi:hypothetical protein